MNTFHSAIKVPFVLFNLSSGERIVCSLIPSIQVGYLYLVYVLFYVLHD
jgi:hypothetical protein